MISKNIFILASKKLDDSSEVFAAAAQGCTVGASEDDTPQNDSKRFRSVIK